MTVSVKGAAVTVICPQTSVSGIFHASFLGLIDAVLLDD
jgi:hypothetical protein